MGIQVRAKLKHNIQLKLCVAFKWTEQVTCLFHHQAAFGKNEKKEWVGWENWEKVWKEKEKEEPKTKW